MRRGIAVAVAALMVVFGALPGLAADRPTGERASVESIDRPAERPTQQTDAPAIDVDQSRTDGPSDRVSPPARPVDREVDQVTDRDVDRYRCVDVVTDRHCVDDRHPHVNVRHLIQRLINAGEWEKLFRLLHRLGIV